MNPSMFQKHYVIDKQNVIKGPGFEEGFEAQNASPENIREAFEATYATDGLELFRERMTNLGIGIEQEIESVESEIGNLGDDIVEGLCQRFADDCELYEENGDVPEWLRWVVIGVLKKKGITDL
jgi:hypothetical protein